MEEERVTSAAPVAPVARFTRRDVREAEGGFALDEGEDGGGDDGGEYVPVKKRRVLESQELHKRLGKGGAPLGDDNGSGRDGMPQAVEPPQVRLPSTPSRTAACPCVCVRPFLSVPLTTFRRVTRRRRVCSSGLPR